MLAIRFARVGRKNRPQFKVVLQEHTIAPGGRHVAVLGSYDPCQKVAVLKADKIKEWLAKGAQASNSAYNLFVREGIIEGKKRAIKMKRPKAAVTEEVKTETPTGEVKPEEAKPAEPVAETKEEVKAEEKKEEPKPAAEEIVEKKEEIKAE